MNKKITAIITTATVALGSAGVAGIIKATEPKYEPIMNEVITEEVKTPEEIKVEEVETPAIVETFVATPEPSCYMLDTYGTTNVEEAFRVYHQSNETLQRRYKETTDFMAREGITTLEEYITRTYAPFYASERAIYYSLVNMAGQC